MRTFAVLVASSLVACGSGSTPTPDASIVEAGEDTAVVCNARCTAPAVCCQNQCVRTDNDPAACGACGVHCSGDTPFCDNGKCVPQPCTTDASACANPFGCCGGSCCGGNEICCKDRSNSQPFCHAPSADQPSCP